MENVFSSEERRRTCLDTQFCVLAAKTLVRMGIRAADWEGAVNDGTSQRVVGGGMIGCGEVDGIGIGSREL